MGKIIKEILSPDAKKRWERIETTRAMQLEHATNEIKREATLTASDGGYDVTQREVQAGRRISRYDFVFRVRKLNREIAYQRTAKYPNMGGLYFQGRFICGLPHEQINEFSTRITVPKVIPDPTIAHHWTTIQAIDNQEPGWRSILLRLLQEGLLSPVAIDREFKIRQGRSSRVWQQAVN